jgi:hypothetical protein
MKLNRNQLTEAIHHTLPIHVAIMMDVMLWVQSLEETNPTFNFGDRWELLRFGLVLHFIFVRDVGLALALALALLLLTIRIAAYDRQCLIWKDDE